MRHFLLFILSFSVSFTIIGQTLVLSGKATEAGTHEPLSGVLVTLRPPGENKVVKFAQTSANGTFEIKLTDFPENHVLHFSMMGFGPQTVPLKSGQTTYNVQLAEKATELKEVIVKAPSIHQRGDTITYVVSNFADAQDKSLADAPKDARH